MTSIKHTFGEVVLEHKGQSSGGLEKYEAILDLGNGNKAYVKVYMAPVEKVAEAKAPTVRKAKETKTETAVADPFAGLSEAQKTTLARVIAGLNLK
jgi:hypothetical protein